MTTQINDCSTYDYIIVGAGSSGCTAAYRLAQRSSATVLLIEAGGSDDQFIIKTPVGFASLLADGKNNWNYHSQAEPGLDDRSIALPRGKVLGGCSSTNGMVYIRGQRQDYDGWAALGNAGWSYDDVLPLFKRSENNWRGATQYHGVDGPLNIEPVDTTFTIGDAFIDAVAETGASKNDDFNGAAQEGVGYFDTTIASGIRQNCSRAFLNQEPQPSNLTVLSGIDVQRILFDGTRAIGVEGIHTNGSSELSTYHANKEIIVSAGAYNTPKLLELSGIGCRKRLNELGIEVISDLSQVGENLQDHSNNYMFFDTQQCETYYQHIRWWRAPFTALQYLFKKQGIFANPAAQIGAFITLDDDNERPDAQIHFTAAAAKNNDKGVMLPVQGVCACICQLRPHSIGSSHIQSDDPSTAPAIQLNLLKDERDQQFQIRAIRKLRVIFAQPALADFIGEELAPTAGLESDDEILNGIKQSAESTHHPIGTCRMGIDDDAVVSPDLKVKGVQGLRIADASIMPTLISGNTNATCIMIGEKLTDLVLAAD